MHYAHSVAGRDESDWEPLGAHLAAVAALAERSAGAFGSGPWGGLAGLWHDLGKYRPEFQARLRGKCEQVEHAGVGAAMAGRIKEGGLALAFAIAGHHAGLANARSNDSAETVPGAAAGLPLPLTHRLGNARRDLGTVESLLPPALRAAASPPLPVFLQKLTPGDAAKRAIEFWTRMLFSALVDADRRATAAFYARFEPALLHDDLAYDDIPTLRTRLDGHIDRLAAEARARGPSRVNDLRAEVLAACRARAADPPGRFSLTVPTGGGKTLAALSFALGHAKTRDLRRVIVAIPYTSIIEQNAKVYREALDDPSRPDVRNVLEHHSNLDEQRAAEQDGEAELRRKLAAENWSAPVVITTSVQLFESLFSNHPSRCRKLHHVAKSVIVLDEVQTLPAQLLNPILDGLTELTDHYGCTLVLSTATPPALAKRAGQAYGLEGVREIMPDPAGLAQRARRVRVTWPERDKVLPYAEVAAEMKRRDRVLAIVHRRRDARAIAEMLPPEGTFHLSALMCPAHRLAVLAQVKAALGPKGDNRGLCRLVATQLVEAGVDLDFPVVYRALAGLDSLAQAAGRCDREGRLTEAAGAPAGELIVFRAETPPPRGSLLKAMQTTETLLGLGPLDPFDPESSLRFFAELYEKHDRDRHGIQLDRATLDFATTAAKFRMIDNLHQRPLVVPWGEAMERVERFRLTPTLANQRALQPFLVQINVQHYEALNSANAIISLYDRIDVPTSAFGRRYHPVFGLNPDEKGVMDAEVSVS